MTPYVPAWAVLLVSAPAIGSFLGVLIRRLPAGRPVLASRSVCETCGRTLAGIDLVPLLSFLALRGRCRGCRAPIAWFHLVIELAALGIATWAVIAVRGADRQAATCVLGWLLLPLAWIDWTHFWLPDGLTLPLLLLGLAATAWLDGAALTEHAAGAAVGYLLFRAVGWSYRRLMGRDGLGQGDAKLLAAGGAWLGLGALSGLIVASAAAGIALAVGRHLAGERLTRRSAIPFGCAISAALWTLWLRSG